MQNKKNMIFKHVIKKLFLEGHNSISYIVCLKIKSNLLYFETREKSRQFVNRKRL